MPKGPAIDNVHIIYPRKSRYFIIPDHEINRFFGMNNIITDLYDYPDGVTPDSLNWITGTQNDCIILRRGYHLLGQTRQTGAGAITGLGIGNKADGTQIPFFTTNDRRLKYYDSVSDDTVEIGSQIIPTGAVNDQFSIYPYQNLAGYFVYVSSPNWDIVKIPVANPASYVLQSSVNYKGYMKFGQSRAVLWNRKDNNGGQDKTGEYMSFVDAATLVNDGTNYAYTGTTTLGSTSITSMSSITSLAAGMAIVGAGIPPSAKVVSASGSTVVMDVPATASASGVTLTFSTLPFPFAQTTNEAVGSLGAKTYTYTLTKVTGTKTCFQVQVTATVAAGTETFTDDMNGKLTSNFGGTGTVNYGTGAISVTFSDTTTGAVTANYYTEDATSGGVANFASTKGGSPAARVAGSGRFFPQYDGGNLNAVLPLANVFYGFHQLKTYQTSVNTQDDDSTAPATSNLEFRDKMGVSTPNSAYATPMGIFYINNANPALPEVYVLKLHTGATSANIAAPALVSQALNLSGFNFDYAAMFQWGIYILLACAQIRNGAADTYNSRTFIYNTHSGAWDLLDYPTSYFADYSGTLLSGDPLTNNVYKLFDGLDDDNGIITNYWTSGWTHHGTLGLKTHMRMVINGLIQSSQNIAVDLAYDGGGFSEVFRILGNGAYVDSSQSIAVGSYTLGSKLQGGGATITAHPFEADFNIASDRFEFVRVRFRACVANPSDTDPNRTEGGGWAQINFYKFAMIRFKGVKSPQSRQAN